MFVASIDATAYSPDALPISDRYLLSAAELTSANPGIPTTRIPSEAAPVCAGKSEIKIASLPANITVSPAARSAFTNLLPRDW